MIYSVPLKREHRESDDIASTDLSDLLELIRLENDYDRHYDQRQKGEENLRIHLDEFFISIPTSSGTSAENSLNIDSALLLLLGGKLKHLKNFN